MADDGPCFGFKKKSVVMTCIGLCCLALVIWTILVTGGFPFITGEIEPSPSPSPEEMSLEGADSLALGPLKLAGVCPVNSSLGLDKWSFALSKMPEVGEIGESRRPAVKHKNIPSKGKALCKCLCEESVSTKELVHALIKRKPTPPSGKKKTDTPGSVESSIFSLQPL